MTIDENTTKIGELINKINSLPTASAGTTGSDGFSPTIRVETVTGGHKIIITDINGTQDFFVADGSPGATGDAGDDGVGIVSIEQTTTSSASGGTNVITVALSNGETSTFNVKNGSKGSTGANATINGVNTLTLSTRTGITLSHSGSNMIIGADLTHLLATGPIILKEGVDLHYGDTLPAAGTKGRLFFLKKKT